MRHLRDGLPSAKFPAAWQRLLDSVRREKCDYIDNSERRLLGRRRCKFTPALTPGCVRPSRTVANGAHRVRCCGARECRLAEKGGLRVLEASKMTQFGSPACGFEDRFRHPCACERQMAVGNSLESGKCASLVSAAVGFVHDHINWLNRLATLFIRFSGLVCAGGSMTSVPPPPSSLTKKLFAMWLPARVRSTRCRSPSIR